MQCERFVVPAPGVQLSQLTSSSSCKAYFTKDCGQHLTCRSMDSLKKISTRGGSLPCKLCTLQMPGGEALAWEILQYTLPSAGLAALHEDFTVQGSNTSADFTIYCTRTWLALLIIMVDGAGHVHSAMHGTLLATQKKRDELFDTLAFRQGLRVLRLHCSDWPYFTLWVNRALQAARTDPNRRWVLYSLKYGKLPMM